MNIARHIVFSVIWALFFTFQVAATTLDSNSWERAGEYLESQYLLFLQETLKENKSAIKPDPGQAILGSFV